MTSMHEPTPEFERYLEWQVTTALRRQDRFARPARVRSTGYLRAVSIVVVSVLLGAGGVMAAGRLQQNQETQLLSVQQQGELQLAQVQVEIAQKNLDQTKKRVEVGVAPIEDVAAAERALRTMALRLQRVEFSLEEVRASGRPAQDDVTAPLVGGRDFVLLRMQLDQEMLAAAAAEAEKNLQAIRRMSEAGLTSQLRLLEAETDVTRSTADVNGMKEKMALRQQFVAGNVSAEAATRQRLIIAAQTELQAAQAARDLASQRSAQLDKMKQLGTVGDMDVLKARLDLLSRQMDIERLRERLTLLLKGGQLPDGGR